MLRNGERDVPHSHAHKSMPTSIPTRGHHPIYVCISEVFIPCITDYLVQITLQHDEDLDGQIPSPVTRLTYRSDEWHEVLVRGNASRGKLELACTFIFPRNALKMLRLHDARLLVEIQGINPGSGAITTVAKDVFNLVIDESNDSIANVSETRFLSGSFWDRSAQLHVGRYSIEINGSEFVS